MLLGDGCVVRVCAVIRLVGCATLPSAKWSSAAALVRWLGIGLLTEARAKGREVRDSLMHVARWGMYAR